MGTWVKPETAEAGDTEHTKLPPEAIERVINLLVAERQHLREIEAEAEYLEVNRQALVYWQRELVHSRKRAPA
jgi:hypothetical protein